MMESPTISAKPARASLPPGTGTLLATLLLGVFIGAVDLAIVAPALRTLGEQFAVDDRALTWVFTIYVLANVAALPLMGKLSDRFGRRPVFIAGVAVFGLGSLLAAVAPSYGIFLLARAIQAAGAGGLFPVAAAVIGDVIPVDRRGIFLALTGSTWGIATVVGPPIGGVVTQNFGWQWIFLINLPLCALAIGLAMRTLPSVPGRLRAAFDWPGLALLTAALVSLTYGLVQLDGSLPALGLLRLESGGFVLLAVALLVPWVVVERRAVDPIVRLTLLTRRQLLLANLLSLFTGFSEAALLFLPAYASLRLGVDTQTAPLFLVVGALALLVGTAGVGVLLDRFGSRLTLIIGGVLTALGMFWVGTLATEVVPFLLALILGGLGLSALLGTPLRYIVTNETSREERSVALAVLSIFTTAGIAVGSAVTGAVVGTAGAGREVEGYAAVYVMIGAASVVAIGLASLLKGRRAERASTT